MPKAIKACINRFISYKGSLEFTPLNDQEPQAGYQHKFVVQNYAGYIRDKKVLDAGCWTAPIASAIKEEALSTELVGLDENEDALSVARRNFTEFKFLRCKLTDPDKKIESGYAAYFDTVIFLDVLEHLLSGSEISVLKFLNSLLKKEGVMVISTMADHIFNIIDPAWAMGHRHYKLKTVRQMLEAAGFDIIEAKEAGNLWWDIDLLFFYFSKHLLRKKYRTPVFIRKKIMRGLDKTFIATRLYILAKKRMTQVN
ncbi:MAG: class I SAM-dependent methyltransferase [Candidatus Omnitrophica bacterium]|nr:class I SAM-dependent methyltransferase [Candidatus Omnitrophota bacterium]